MYTDQDSSTAPTQELQNNGNSGSKMIRKPPCTSDVASQRPGGQTNLKLLSGKDVRSLKSLGVVNLRCELEQHIPNYS